MALAPHHIVRAWLESPTVGIIELDRDWTDPLEPHFALDAGAPDLVRLTPAPAIAAGRNYGYFLNDRSELVFLLPLEHGCDIDPARDKVYLAGDFNGWQAAVGAAEWQLYPEVVGGEQVLLWKGAAARFLAQPGMRFKFVTDSHQWIVPPGATPNVSRDEYGNLNLVIDPRRTGWHLWSFSVARPFDLAESWTVGWASAGGRVSIGPGNFFFELKTDLPLGALVSAEQTTFRLFAPRARSVTLFVQRPVTEKIEEATSAAGDEGNADAAGVKTAPAKVSAAAVGALTAEIFSLSRRADADGAAGVWELVVPANLHGASYWYSVDGVREGPGRFDPAVRVMDPYALAALNGAGPGLVLDAAWVGEGDQSFRAPPWQDLILAEAHVRDLTAGAPVTLTPEERRGFTGLAKWVASEDFYLHRLGVNCVELQPVHEYEATTVEEYQWGYMPCSYFAPASGYSLNPAKASGVRELQELVRAFHRRGIAVVLDVVFNHVGNPPHLMAIDRLHYFEQDSAGQLANWSGCGNDLRAHAAMAKRLIIDSCTHYLKAYGVDGFRFDLAELLGVEVLREIEVALKRVKPDVILIAEPWSFRGHIVGALRDTGWTSWNDGYRNFIREYVCGMGGADRLEYFLRGSPWYFAKWPAQTVNYTESHDDRTWIDCISENHGGNGHEPTAADRRRTHLMAAILLMSAGIPMIASGQDFLRSKHGVNNTYLRGDLNALDYGRVRKHGSTHVYFAEWIAFRRSETGRLLRLFSRPGEGFFRFFRADHSPAVAAVYNADLSCGPTRLLFAINPTRGDVTIRLDREVAQSPGWKLRADHERFYAVDGPGLRPTLGAELFVPALGCLLWVDES